MISNGQVTPPSDMNIILQDTFFKCRKQVLTEMSNMTEASINSNSFAEILDGLVYRILMERVIENKNEKAIWREDTLKKMKEWGVKDEDIMNPQFMPDIDDTQAQIMLIQRFLSMSHYFGEKNSIEDVNPITEIKGQKTGENKKLKYGSASM